MGTASVLPVKWSRFFCALAALYSVAVMFYIVNGTAKPEGARDFHPFWYAGHFILQGHDPYAAYLAEEQPRLPIHYLDGITIDQYPITQGNFSAIPSNTPFMLMLLAPFSFFSWETAKWLFLFVNLILMLLTGWIAIWKIPFAGVTLSREEALLLFLLYFDLSATRIAIENGQTTLLVFLMMLLALLHAKRFWTISGIALGVALSKYSLSLPMFVFFLYRRNFKILFAAVIVQIIGLLALAILSRSSPVMIVRENIQLFEEIFGQPGIHLSHFFELFTNNRILTEIPVLILTLLVFLPILVWQRPISLTSSAQDMFDLHLVTILFIWAMLIGYHRLYDTLILIVFPVLIFKGLVHPHTWSLSKKSRLIVFTFLAITPLIMIVPARLVDIIIPHYYGTISDAVTTVYLLAMLSLTMFLLRQFLLNLQNKITKQRLESHGIPTDPF